MMQSARLVAFFGLSIVVVVVVNIWEKDATIRKPSTIPSIATSSTHRRLVGPDASEIDDRIHTSQSTALRQIFEPLDVTSSQYLNWDFETKSFVQYCFFIGIECDSEGFVTAIDLTGQNLEGPLPDRFAALSRLRRFKVFDNELSGRLPHSLVRLTNLNNLNIGHNSFSGLFPTLPPSLTRVILDRNSFSGVVPTSLCKLTGLESLDMTSLTRMTGSIPSCLGSLTALTKLRITDVGLAGPVPPLLCTKREMNGLMPNTFGCDAIACPAGYFQRPAGRLTGPGSPCRKCDVPSNAVGSSSCQWHATLEKTREPNASPPPSSSPSGTPTRARSNAPSTSPTPSPSAQPTTTPTSIPTTTSLQPSSQSSVLRTSFPQTDTTISSQPSTSRTNTLFRPSGSPFVTQSTQTPQTFSVAKSDEPGRSKLSVVAAILIPALLCILLPLFALHRHSRNVKGTENTELLSPDTTRSTDNSFDGIMDKIHVLEVGSPKTEAKETIEPSHQPSNQPSPSSCRKGRKVRFNFPETIPEDPSGEQLAALSGSFDDEERPKPVPPAPVTTPDNDDDTPVGWFSSPMFYPVRSCQAPCGAADGSTTSTLSIGMNENHISPPSGRHSPSTITMEDCASSGDELEAVLGIRDPPVSAKRSSVDRLALDLIPSNDEDMIVYNLDDGYHDVVDEELKTGHV